MAAKKGRHKFTKMSAFELPLANFHPTNVTGNGKIRFGTIDSAQRRKVLEGPFSMSRQRIVLIVTVLAIAGPAAMYRISPKPLISTAYAKEKVDTAAAQAPRAAPDFELKDINGVTHKLSDYKGKVVVLNFWATWCPPCKKEIPDFIELQKQYEAQGVQFIGIAMDDEGLDKVKPWVTSHSIQYPILIPDLPDKKVATSFGEMSSIPVTYFIDRKGMIRQTFIGMRTRPIFEGELKPLVAEK
jgi:peroxiredoxin